MNVRRTSVQLLLSFRLVAASSFTRRHVYRIAMWSACVALLLAPRLQAQCISLTTLNSAYFQDFNTLAVSGTSSAVPAGWAFSEAGSNANTTYSAGTGSSTAGDTYSFGAAGTTERAFGTLLSGSLVPTIGACFTNNTGATVTALGIAYMGEEWRLGATGRGPDRLDFQYSTNATTLTSGTWTGVSALSFSTPNVAAVGALDGNLAANRTAVSSVVDGLSIPAGATFWIRWSDFNATSSDDGLAIDDFSLTPTASASVPTLSVSNVSAQEGDSGTTNFNFVVSLTGGTAPAGGVTFDIATVDGTATAGSDYIAKSLSAQTVASTYTFTVAVNGDPDVESDETFGVQITNIVGAKNTSAQATGTILNDDSSIPPVGSGSATPSSVATGNTTLLTASVTPGVKPASTGLTVTADLTAIGGSSAQVLYDDGSHGDVTAGDNVFSFLATVGNVDPGTKTLPVTITDAQSRSGSASITLQVQPPPPPTTVKISQVYGGGGNSGSTFTNDFVELFNQGTTPINLAGWSVQYHSAGSDTTAWSVADLCPTSPCVIQPGHYFLVQGAKGNGGTTSLPAPDVIGTLSMGGSNGKVALVASLTPIAGNACTSGGTLVDLVGYGTSTCFLGNAAAPALDAPTAAVRRHNGCTDSGDNRNDFVAIGPIPRNSSSPVNDCSSDPTQLHGFATADSVEPAGQTRITVSVVAASAPVSTNIGVSADLTDIGGSASQSLYDDGTHGDAVAGDNTFSFEATVGLSTPTGVKNIPATVSDAEGRNAAVPVTMSVVSPTCGIERWSVKVGVDPDAPQVDLNNPMATDIVTLRGITAPPAPPDNARVLPTEGTVYVVNGTMTLFKKEDDVDYHIVVQDANGKTIVTEIPAPPCIVTTASPRVAAPSPFSSGITLARTKFDARFTPNSFFQSVTVPVQVTGVGFFDFIHGQTGVAPNGIELHPLLDINFTNNTTTTLVSSANPSQYGQTVALTATVSNGGITVPTGKVSFFDGGVATVAVALNGGQATYNTNGLSVGSHSITATYEGDSTSAPSASTALVQVVGRADQSITFAPLSGRTFGDPDFVVSGSASSALPVTFAIVSGPATITGSSIHITGAGTVTVRASQAGDASYNAAADVDQSFVVAPAQPTVVVTGGSFAYDRDAHGASAVATGIGGATLAGQFAFTYNGSAATPTNAGRYEVVATFASDDVNYGTAVGHGTLTITKVAPVVAVSGGPFTYDATPKTATATVTGVGGEAVSGTFAITYNGASSAVNAGNYTVDVAFTSTSGNYTNATGSGSMTITAAVPTVTVGGGPFVYDGTSRSAIAVAHGVSNSTVPGTFVLTYNGSPAPPVNAGAYNVVAVFSSSDPNYAGASGTGGILINKAMPAVAVSGGPFMYDGSPKTAVATATGIGGAIVSGAFTFTYNGSALAPTNPGVYSVVAAFVSSDGNYSNTTGTGSIVIRGLRDELQDELTALGKLRDATTNKQDLDKLNDAIKHLANALEPDLWLDTIHVSAAEGDEVFTETKNALIPLLMLSRDAKSSVSQAALQGIVGRIAMDDRLLAMTAINDARARGANVDKAQAELTRGDADVASGQFESAIEHYRSAWASAMK